MRNGKEFHAHLIRFCPSQVTMSSFEVAGIGSTCTQTQSQDPSGDLNFE